MKEENIIKLGRWILGFGCLCLHAITHVNGNVVLIAMVLLGVPFEIAKKEKT